MEEEKIVTEEQQEEEVSLESVQLAILRQIGNGLTDDEIEPTLEAFNAVSRALADERKAGNVAEEGRRNPHGGKCQQRAGVENQAVKMKG